jgi:mxaD protein
MPHAEASAVIGTDAETLWRAAGGFADVGWHPWLASVNTDGTGVGSRRTAVGQDGSQQIERLDHVDAEVRCYRYTMESTGLPVADYVGEFNIDPRDVSSCTVRWTSEFRATSDNETDAVNAVQSFLDAGIDELRRRYG